MKIHLKICRALIEIQSTYENTIEYIQYTNKIYENTLKDMKIQDLQSAHENALKDLLCKYATSQRIANTFVMMKRV